MHPLWFALFLRCENGCILQVRHSDLKSRNVLLNSAMMAKISDVRASLFSHVSILCQHRCQCKIAPRAVVYKRVRSSTDLTHIKVSQCRWALQSSSMRTQIMRRCWHVSVSGSCRMSSANVLMPPAL